MTKAILFIALFLGITSILPAQNFSYEQGSNRGSNNLNFQNNIETPSYLSTLPNIPISKAFSIQPEFFYANLGDASLLNLPVFFKVPLGESKFSIVGGPQANFFIDETGKDLNSFGVDLSFGLQYEISNSFLIEGRYSFAVSNSFTDNSIDYKSRFHTFFIRLLYRF
tara:strand:- start:779 stop:1279 length:501 start_codon:yes stop_codon:yes gene_type:complete